MEKPDEGPRKPTFELLVPALSRWTAAVTGLLECRTRAGTHVDPDVDDDR